METLAPLAVSEIPDAVEDLQLLHSEVALPSSSRPSDHVSLSVVFSYLEDVRGYVAYLIDLF